MKKITRLSGDFLERSGQSVQIQDMATIRRNGSPFDGPFLEISLAKGVSMETEFFVGDGGELTFKKGSREVNFPCILY